MASFVPSLVRSTGANDGVGVGGGAAVDEAAKMGVSAIIQPGGSVKDADSVAAADEHGLTMMFTGPWRS